MGECSVLSQVPFAGEYLGMGECSVPSQCPFSALPIDVVDCKSLDSWYFPIKKTEMLLNVASVSYRKTIRERTCFVYLPRTNQFLVYFVIHNHHHGHHLSPSSVVIRVVSAYPCGVGLRQSLNLLTSSSSQFRLRSGAQAACNGMQWLWGGAPQIRSFMA